DAIGERGRERHDRAARADLAALGVDGDAPLVLGDRADRPAEHQAIAERLGQAPAELLRAADEAPLLRAVSDLREAHEPSARAQVEEEVEEGELARLGGEDRARRDVEHGAGAARLQVAALPLLERERVE